MLAGLLKKYWFLLGVVAASLLGLLLPGAAGRLNPRSLTTNGIVAILFVLTGLALSTEAVWKGVRDLRLHAYLQLFIFALTPAWFAGSLRLLRGVLPGSLNVGILALACLPTTVSSCVVFTQSSGGNTAGALFSSTLANGLGVVVSPLLITLLLKEASYALPPSALARILANLGLTILAPFAAGQLLRRLFARSFAEKHRAGLSLLSNCLILAIIFFAFGRSAGGELLRQTASALLPVFGYLALSHLLLAAAAYGGARLLGMGAGDRIAALYVAPQKTIAMGLPLLSSYFAARQDLLAVAILPLMFYHAFQLLAAGLLRSTAWLERERGR